MNEFLAFECEQKGGKKMRTNRRLFKRTSLVLIAALLKSIELNHHTEEHIDFYIIDFCKLIIVQI